MSLAQLQPANSQDVRVYMPYFQGNKRNILPLAISLYKKGVLQGQRKIEGGGKYSFCCYLERFDVTCRFSPVSDAV